MLGVARTLLRMLLLLLGNHLRCSRSFVPILVLKRYPILSSATDQNPVFRVSTSHSNSSYVHHVLIEHPATVLDVVQETLQRQNTTQYTAQQLMRLGSIWHLSTRIAAKQKDAKPLRVQKNISLNVSDYLRIHHSPRRYKTGQYCWTIGHPLSVVVHQGPDFLVIHKPPGIPVHSTVDNHLDNVAHALSASNNNMEIWTPQRLDHNTSGLLVVGTTKAFATYYASLLKQKTASRLVNNNTSSNNTKQQPPDAIHKTYRCLVCLNDADRILELHKWVGEKAIMKHYLEPSVRAPKVYHDRPQGENWAESLLRIVYAGKYYPIIDNHSLQRRLWEAGNQPEDCVGVTELEIELLTGRTHQIRGQLRALNLPIVGDVQYGGALPLSGAEKLQDNYYYFDSDRLALQCCELSFVDPDRHNHDNVTQLKQSDRWNRFQLDAAWWTPMLQPPARPELLPNRVSLSPGVHKYVLIKATHPFGDDEWFVKSAAPNECGGPYHGHVAQDLREWIEAAGYEAEVTGGGRLDYREGRVILYGHSNAFGKADHTLAARLISECSNGQIETFCDHSEGLY